MREIVFIIGAGASVHAGAPVMANFLDVARSLDLSRRGDADADFTRVFSAISKLQIVHSKAQLDLVNLESVFGAFEMAKLLNTFPETASTEITTLSTSLRKVILTTLEESIKFPIVNGNVEPPSGYKRLAILAAQLKASIITFNYDIALDYALFQKGIVVEYGFPYDSGSQHQYRRAVPLLKLHGSANWLQCSSCGKLYARTPRLHQSDFFLTGLNETTLAVNSSFLENSNCKCGSALDQSPVIVPPSWDKTEYRSSIAKVWKEAAKVLSQATSLFVCGYSMPDSDSFFRYLYALGSVGQPLLQHFEVFDPGDGVRERFEGLLGRGAEQRFKYHKAHLEGLLDSVTGMFQDQIRQSGFK